MIQNIWDTEKSNTQRVVYSDTNLAEETRKILNNLTLYLKKPEKEEQTPKIITRRMKEIIRIRAEIET